ISVLCNYVYLQKLELPHNKIRLSCVSHMPYLVILDASHNEISNFFEFQPPKNLKEVNFSHNRMIKMKDLSAYLSLSRLDLDNSFREISGLEQCCKLIHLSLAHNRISRISGLDSLPLRHLCLRGNQLETIEGLENLKSLQVLDLSMNRVSSLSGLQNLHLLGSINLEKNLEQPDYRLAVIFLLQHLTVLDQEIVSAEEKVSSVNKYDPPLDVVAARDHMTHLVYQLMQPQVSTLPSADSPYPMLVLTGPQGCGKRELAHRLCQEFNEYFAHTCHTTRAPYFGEENGLDYHFVSEEDFQNMIPMGKFIQTLQYGGHSYGLTRDAIEDVAREGLACCVHMELEQGVFSLKNSYFEPRYILLIPVQVETYMGHLKDRGLYTPAQIDVAVSRIELYANTNRQRPGFFDNVIPCDREEAYQTLRQVVKSYLLLEEQEEGENNNRASPDNTSTLQELASIRRREQLVREAIVGKSPGVYSQLFKSDESRASSALSVPSSAGALQPPDTPRPGTDQAPAIVSPSSERRPGSNVKPILPPIPTGR
uniref:Leucine rich repeats and guanylate kinase domain containing n=1 Tax=Stegastes partitus TaxID=144197 RepID=A0A3B4ZV31_9TELE